MLGIYRRLIKFGLGGALVFVFSLIVCAPAGFCLSDRETKETMAGSQSGPSRAWVNADSTETKESVFTTAYTALPHVSETKASGGNKELKESIKALHQAGFSAADIMRMTGRRGDSGEKMDIGTVGFFCLVAGLEGMDVYEAIIELGYPKKTAEAVVPAALRKSGQVLPDSAEHAGAEKEAFFKRKESVSNTDSAAAERADAFGNSPNTFHGLGEWNRFQEKRFENKVYK